MQIVDFYRKVLSEIEYVINVFLRILSQINYDIESDLLSKYTFCNEIERDFY